MLTLTISMHWPAWLLIGLLLSISGKAFQQGGSLTLVVEIGCLKLC